MRLYALFLAGAAIAAAIPFSAEAAPVAADYQAVASAWQVNFSYIPLPSRLLLGAGRLCPARQVQAGSLRAAPVSRLQQVTSPPARFASRLPGSLRCAPRQRAKCQPRCGLPVVGADHI